MVLLRHQLVFPILISFPEKVNIASTGLSVMKSDLFGVDKQIDSQIEDNLNKSHKVNDTTSCKSRRRLGLLLDLHEPLHVTMALAPTFRLPATPVDTPNCMKANTSLLVMQSSSISLSGLFKELSQAGWTIRQTRNRRSGWVYWTQMLFNLVHIQSQIHTTVRLKILSRLWRRDLGRQEEKQGAINSFI